MWPTGGKMIKSLALVWNTTTVLHIIQETDSYNCPASKTTGQFSTEAWVAVMILYGVMKRVLQHQQFMIETVFFFSAAKFVLVFFMLHTELLLHRAENRNFEWTVFLSSVFFFFLFMDIICPGAYQNNLFILIGVCSTEETKMGWLVLVTLLFHFLLLIARLLNSNVL